MVTRECSLSRRVACLSEPTLTRLRMFASYSARFRAHLASNQVPFKSTIYPEWYEGRIQPWVHYVSLVRSAT